MKKSCGQIKILIIRRLQCTVCRRIHHELPDCLVPYKRYESECIEEIITNDSSSLSVAADEATLYRIRKWFLTQVQNLLGTLKSIALQLRQISVKEQSELSLPAHHRLGLYVGKTPGWLARTVRAVVNSNLWIHTRFAFLSGSS
jgi:hypothetical protein